MEASWAISWVPPSQKGSCWWTSTLTSESMKLHRKQHTNDWRSTRRAPSKSLAPMKWATCTEKPILAAEANPPNNHVVVSTRPMAAVCRVPRWPIMA